MGWFSTDVSPVAQHKDSTDQPTSLEGTYKPMKRDERQRCWEARDVYFQCLDRNNILDSIKDVEKASTSCGKEEDKFKQDCATSWVTYFKQKRVADFNKTQQLKKLEAEGAVPIAQATEQPKWKLW